MRRKLKFELVLGRDDPEPKLPHSDLARMKLPMFPKIMASGGVEGVPWMLDCSFWTIKVRFSQEFGEYRISAFHVL